MFSQKKPYSAVTVTVERLTGEVYEEDDLSGLPDLVEVIKLQGSGPTEASRAIRKKLKYGSAHRQLRALVILDGLIQNAGPRFQRSFADEMLLERLRVCGTSDLTDPAVKKKCSELFRNWANEYKTTPGLERVARLYKELPKRKQVVTQERSKVIRETDANPFGDDEDDETPAVNSPGEASSSHTTAQLSTQPTGQVSSFSYLGGSKDKADKKKKDKKHSPKKSGSKFHRKFNLEAEKDQMKVTIAEASIAATNLNNALQSINRERERISENAEATAHFETCKQLRRKILRYIQHVESEQWLGSLLHANDELVTALMTFEQLDRSIDADSDSDDELAEQAHMYRMMTDKSKSPTSPTSPPSGEMGNLSITPASPPPPPKSARPTAPPPRPSAMSKPQQASSSPHLSLPSSGAGKKAAAAATASSDDSDDSDNGDENDPFADRNAVVTPRVERAEPTW